MNLKAQTAIHTTAATVLILTLLVVPFSYGLGLTFGSGLEILLGLQLLSLAVLFYARPWYERGPDSTYAVLTVCAGALIALPQQESSGL